MAHMTQKFTVTSCGEKNQGAYPAANLGGLMGGVVWGQKTGGRQAEAHREQYLLEMEYGF